MEFYRTFLMTSLAVLLTVGALSALVYILTIIVPKFFRRSRFNAAFSFSAFDVIENHTDIMRLLAVIKDQKVRFKIKLNNRGTSFNSALLNFDTSSLLIDALFPPEGNELIQHSNFITVSFTIREANHIPYIFRTMFLSGEIFQSYPALRIAFPQSIKRDQRRNFHRVEPSVQEPLYISFILDGSPLHCKIANISGGGVAFYTNVSKMTLWPGRHIDFASIILPHSTIRNCMAIVYTISQTAYPVLIDGKPFHFLCGAEYVDIDNATREKIIRYVIEKERDELKRVSREFE